MKKLLLTLSFFLFTFSAFSTDNKPLIIYFSHTGNTEKVAEVIQKETGADIFRIETEKPYPRNYRETTEIVQEEFNKGYYPPLKTSKLDSLSSYNTVFIGYPIWWGTMPMAVQNFIKQNNFEGKKIIPFCTHGGSEFGRSITELKEIASGADVLDNGFETRNAGSARTEEEIKRWIKSTL